MLVGRLKRGMKLLAAVAAVAALALASVSGSAGTAQAAKKSPRMYAVSAFPTIYKQDGTLTQPTDPRNHWYIDVWDSSNRLTVTVNKKAKGKVCIYLSHDGSPFAKISCKKLKKGRVVFQSNPDATSLDRYDDSDSPLCAGSLAGSFDCDASLDAMVNKYFALKGKLVFFPSDKKFTKQSVAVSVTLFDHLTQVGDYRP